MGCKQVAVVCVLKCENLRFQRWLWMVRWSYITDFSNTIYHQWFQSHSSKGTYLLPYGLHTQYVHYDQSQSHARPRWHSISATWRGTESHSSSHNAWSNGCTSSLLIARLKGCARKQKKKTTLRAHVIKLCLKKFSKTRLNFHCKDNLSSDTLLFLNTWWPEYLLITCNVISIPVHLCPAFWMPCSI